MVRVIKCTDHALNMCLLCAVIDLDNGDFGPRPEVIPMNTQNATRGAHGIIIHAHPL